MKVKDKQKLRQEDTKNLLSEIEKLAKEVSNSSLKTKVGKEKNVHAASFSRHHIAVIKTIIREKQIAAAASATTNRGGKKGK